ncbi:hypothetical protein BTO18_09015 [Polaribacter porphyrae]|uniref:TonB-dependent receptor n=1 Tax=Polaribacter porphyrae TaxID=1137780 RepID=A0A2S7WTR2_9FLAO|nr:hypothetical protein BTO18_09015 [Polaribacter porphyrae]
MLVFVGVSAQNAPQKRKIDTVKTEIVEVVTKFDPKIADANKIRKNPVIKLSDRNKKKKLTYSIFSAPVASTFIPKSGVVKGVDVGVRERIYDNYIAAGFGNYTSPYFEAYLHRQTRFQSEFGLLTKYTASFDDVENTLLNSTFSNFVANLFYKQEERYFDWKVGFATEMNQYNWYGLQPNIFAPNVINTINEGQNYNYFKFSGEVDFLDSYIDDANLFISYFSDNFDSKEVLASLHTNFDIPLNVLSSSLNNLAVKTSFELLNGSFKSDYTTLNELAYSIFTIRVNPEYTNDFNSFSLKLGAKIAASFDGENSVNHFLMYPDIKITKPIIKENLNIYVGVTGGLQTNTYKDFTEDNPFVSPTLFITQTSETYNAFLGLNGKINNDISFNLSGSIKEQEDKPLFIRNNSKSNGTNNTVFKGYEYGNSFTVVYDDVKSVSILGELEYDFNKNLTLGTNIQFDNYTTNLQSEAWNLPNVQASIFGKYKTNEWYATTNIFFIGDRKDVFYNAVFPSNNNTVNNLSSFIDININGGYHLNDKFSVFLKLNNVLNNQYERFANFNVQGFQVLGGLTYKFDF